MTPEEIELMDSDATLFLFDDDFDLPPGHCIDDYIGLFTQYKYPGGFDSLDEVLAFLRSHRVP